MVAPLRLLHLEDEAAVRLELERIACDPEGVRRMAGKGVMSCIKIDALECRAANVLKQEMLALGGDAGVARGSVACSIPASDVILFGSLKQLRILPDRLRAQPFGLANIGARIEQLLQRTGTAPAVLQGRSVTLDLSRPRIMGVLNVTPDSFSDGGDFLGGDAALAHARQMVSEGVDIIDVGGESTRPGAPQVTIQQELDRTMPVIEALSRELDLPLSLDTTKSEVAREGLSLGVEFINDISGLTFDEKMAGVVAEAGAGLFLMHTPGDPAVMQQRTEYHDLLGEVVESLDGGVQKALEAGVEFEKLSIDPGIGFGKTAEGNLELLHRLPELRTIGCPILIGTSRKSFLGKVLDQNDPQRRGNGTLATVALGVQGGASLFRVHNVAPAREAALVAWSICNERLPEPDKGA
jgi:dihydropteroate synthase